MMSKHHGNAPRLKSWLIAALVLPTALTLTAPLSFANTNSSIPSDDTQASDAQTQSDGSQNTQGFIRDDLFIYMHAGSSTKFKIVGSINASTPVEKLESDTETNYIKVKDDKGRIGWIENKSFTTDTPVASLLTQANAQIKQLESQNLNVDAQINQLQQQLKDAIDTKDRVSSMLELSETEKTQLQQQITENTDKHQLKQMMFGAGIIVVGLILGLILPHLVPRKRRGDHWV